MSCRGDDRGEVGFGGCTEDSRELGERRVAATQQALSPSIGFVRLARGTGAFGIALQDGTAQRLDIRLAHQAADQLPLPRERTAAAQLLRRQDRLAQLLAQRELRELCCGEVDQRDADALRIECRAFGCTATGSLIAGGWMVEVCA